MELGIQDLERKTYKLRVKTDNIRIKGTKLFDELCSHPFFKHTVSRIQEEELEANELEEKLNRIVESNVEDREAIEEHEEEKKADRLEDESSPKVDEEPEQPIEEEKLSQLKAARKAKRDKKIKDLYRQMTVLCHPDSKKSDKTTQQMFPILDAAYKRGDLGMLEAIKEDLDNYFKSKRSNAYRKSILIQSMRVARQKHHEALLEYRQIHTTIASQLLSIKESMTEYHLHQAFRVALQNWGEGVRDRKRIARMQLQAETAEHERRRGRQTQPPDFGDISGYTVFTT